MSVLQSEGDEEVESEEADKQQDNLAVKIDPEEGEGHQPHQHGVHHERHFLNKVREVFLQRGEDDILAVESCRGHQEGGEGGQEAGQGQGWHWQGVTKPATSQYSNTRKLGSKCKLCYIHIQ